MSLERPSNGTLEKDKNIDKKKREMIEELASFSVRYDNPFHFEDYGFAEVETNLGINNIAKEGLNEREEDSIIESLYILREYIKGPIFTDQFHEDLRSRNDWEFKYITNKPEDLNNDAWEYCKSNRLRGNLSGTVISLLEMLPDDVKNNDLKNKLIGLQEKIPPEFTKKDENGLPIYHSFSDQDKIRVVKELTDIVKEVISLLSK